MLNQYDSLNSTPLTYDTRGQMLTAKKGTPADDDATSAAIFAYNGLGYMETASQSIKGGTAKTVSYIRDQLGQMTQLTVPTTAPVGGVVLDYTYTSLGQVDTITRSGTQLVNYSYRGTYVTGRSYGTTTYAVNFTPQYDKFGRMERSTTVNGSGQGVDFGYTYDDNGNIESQTYHHRNQQTPPANGFTYDDLNRLTETAYQAGNAGTEVFNYDLLGNRDSTTDTRSGGVNYDYVSNNVNEYTDITPASFDPDNDNAGNLIQDKSGYKYAYDYENRLTQIARPDDTVVATFEYDALGRRIEKVDTIAGTTKCYYYDDQRIVLQTNIPYGGSETDYRYFVYGNYIDEVLVMGSKLGSSTWLTFYYAHDHLYSPVALFSISGTVGERYEYDAYGKVTIWDAGFTTIRPVSSAIFASPFSFTGRELDYFDNNTLKIMYYRARSYDPQTGRFLQRDPLQYVDGMNLYEYVKSNLLFTTDPYGCLTQDEIDKIIKQAQAQAAFYLYFGNPLAKKLFGYWMNGQGGEYDLSRSDMQRIFEGMGVLDMLRNLVKDHLSNPFYRDMPIFSCRQIAQLSSGNIHADIPQPSSALDRSLMADLFYSFHEFDWNYEITGFTCRVSCCYYVAYAKLTINLSDNYSFANRDWNPIPGDNETKDSMFWVWQEYGIPAPFSVKGEYTEDLITTFNLCKYLYSK